MSEAASTPQMADDTAPYRFVKASREPKIAGYRVVRATHHEGRWTWVLAREAGA